MRSRVLPIVLLLLVAGLFLVANRGAYKSYFTDDEIDNVALTRNMGNSDFILAFLSPRFYPGNFRPPGHLLFRPMPPTPDFSLPPHVPSLPIPHFLTLVF